MKSVPLESIPENFKVITIYHVHAMAIASGVKKFENRPKAGKYRGQVAIHMGMRQIKKEDQVIPARFKSEINRKEHRKALLRSPNRYGELVAFANVVDCVPKAEALALPGFTEEEKEHITGPFVWVLDNIRSVKPGVMYRGGQGSVRAVDPLQLPIVLRCLTASLQK